MHFSRLTVVAFGVVVGAACGGLGVGTFAAPAADPDPAAELGLPANVAAAMRGIDAERIRAHVRYLSDDLLEGRGTGTRGGDLAAKYIATQFALVGLKPAGDNGGYLQKIEFTGVHTLPATAFALRPEHGSTLELKFGEDFVTTNQTQTEGADIDAPIVFVGYGIEAPEYRWNDFKGVDVKGKVLLVIVNERRQKDPKFFNAEAMTYYGRWTYKFEEAARKGAVVRDHSPHRPRELRLGCGAQFLERGAGVPEQRPGSEAQGGILDTARSGAAIVRSVGLET